MRLIKMTGGLGNQMFIYAFYLQMKKRFSDVYIDLSDMVHYRIHHGYEMNRVFNLPHIEKCYPQKLKKVIEFLFFKTILERKLKDPVSAYKKSSIWPLVYYKGFYQTEKYFKDIDDDILENDTPKICFCRKCGNRLQDGAVFCNKCGTKVVRGE